MLGIIDILCRGVLPFLLLEFRLQLVSFSKVHDVCWGLLILCVVVYYISYFWEFGYILYGICLCF